MSPCMLDRGDMNEHLQSTDHESGESIESNNWDEFADKYLNEPPYLNKFEESSHENDKQPDMDLVVYQKNADNNCVPYKHKKSVLAALAFAGAIEFITSKFTGPNAHLLKAELFEYLTTAGLLRPEYTSNAFASARAYFMLVLNDMTTKICNDSKCTLNFSPNIDLPLSITSGIYAVLSRYYQDFDELECIGKGGFGEVFKARSKIDEQFYAIKKIRLRKFSSPNAFQKMLSECRLHASLDAHPNLLRYHNAWIECASIESVPSTSMKIGSPIDLNKDEIKIKTANVASTKSSLETSSSSTADGPNKFWQKPSQINQSYSSFINSSEKSNESQVKNDISLNELSLTPTQELAPIVQEPTTANAVVKFNSLDFYSEFNYLKFPPVLHIQMELCENTLEVYMDERKEKKEAINDKFNKIVLRSLLSAMAFLHKNRIIHRDIKPSNIFLKMRKEGFHVLLGDFGLAKDQSSDDICLLKRNDSIISSCMSKKLSFGVGTRHYASPEQLNSRNYDSKTDIYSCGIVIYELYNTFQTKMECSNALKALRNTAKTPLEFQKRYPDIAKMIENMIQHESAQRPSAEKLLKIFDLQQTALRKPQIFEENQILRKENEDLKLENQDLRNKNDLLEQQIELLQKKYELLEADIKLQSGS